MTALEFYQGSNNPECILWCLHVSKFMPYIICKFLKQYQQLMLLELGKLSSNNVKCFCSNVIVTGSRLVS
jgi:hypothetical protein